MTCAARFLSVSFIAVLVFVSSIQAEPPAANTRVGKHALASKPEGDFNTAIGFDALKATTIGENNTAVGFDALANNSAGIENTAVGVNALLHNFNASGNTAVGFSALEDNFEGVGNTAMGEGALRNNLAGSANTAVGIGALEGNFLGINNTAVGVGALESNLTGNKNTAIGYRADVSTDSITNSTAIGNGAIVDNSDKIRLGNSSVVLVETAANLKVGAGTTHGCVLDGIGTQIAGSCPSDARLKTDIRSFAPMLEKITALRPVYFRWNRDAATELQLGDGESFGLIAQEAEKILPELITEDARNGYKAVRYNLLPLLLLQAIKEQQAENTALKARLDALEATLKPQAKVTASIAP